MLTQRPYRRWRIILAVAGAVLIHASVVGIGAIWPVRRTPSARDVIGNLDPFKGAEDFLGESAPAAPSVPIAAPDVSVVAVPPDDAVATEPLLPDPELAESPTPAPSPVRDLKPGRARSSRTRPAANAPSLKAVSQGAARGGSATGANASSPRRGINGWRTPKPPYPYEARAARFQGSGRILVSTDDSGAVTSATIQQSVGSAILDSNTVSFARGNWHGPPNSSTTVAITYQLP
jgi:protein TonB